MNVKILTSCSGVKCSFTEGEVVEVSAALGRDLIKAGYAAEIKSVPGRKLKDGDKNADA